MFLEFLGKPLLLAFMIFAERICFYFNQSRGTIFAAVFLQSKILLSMFSPLFWSWLVFRALKLQLKLTILECSTFSFVFSCEVNLYYLYSLLPDIGWKYLIASLEILWESSLKELIQLFCICYFIVHFADNFFFKDPVLESFFHLRQISSTPWINLMFPFLFESKKVHHRRKG